MPSSKTALGPPLRRWRIAATFAIVAGGAFAGLRVLSRNELVTTAATLDYRVTEPRLAGGFGHRPVRPTGTTPIFGDAAAKLYRRWRTDGSPLAGRSAGAALLLGGRSDRALAVLREVLHESTGEADILSAIGRSSDAALLTDYSAAELENAAARRDTRGLLLALEAADRSWDLERSASAAWNRAIAATRLGVHGPAAERWREAIEAETAAAWKEEAVKRRAAAERAANASPAASYEVFFYQELIERTIASLDDRGPRDVLPEIRRTEIAAGDQLASDTAAAMSRLRPAEREFARAALALFVRGRAVFLSERYAEAENAFAAAETMFAELQLPLELLARDQRIRCQCSRAAADCLDNIRRFRAELMASGRYPWLAARAASAEGQTLFRGGRIYEAAEAFETARAELRALKDAASETLLHTQLANVFAAAGETDLALSHYVAATQQRTEAVGDRRRRQLEDAITFTLQHGYLATTELLLDELVTTPATEAGRVMEASLRGVLAARRGDAVAAERHFDQAYALLETVPDPSARSEVSRSLAIASAGFRVRSTQGLEQIDAAIARQREQNSVWMPLLLVERGMAHEQRNELAQAELDYLRAIGILEQREPRIDATILSLGVASERESAFDRLIRLYLRQRRIGEALAISQRSAALRISSLHARGIGARDVYRSARDSGGDAVAELRAVLGPREAAVAFHLLRDELVTWVMTRDTIVMVRRGVRARDLVRAANQLSACRSRADCGVEEVSNLLLRDWIGSVPRETTLLIVPPPETQAVPFAMLETHSGETLLMRNAVAYAPSFRMFIRAARNDAQRKAQVNAFFAAAPRPGGRLDHLPRAASEVAHAARPYRRPAIETQTTRARFVAAARHFAIVHFAGHVLVNEEQPLLSAMVFDQSATGESQMLYVHELDTETFARARLVVLSACETGRSPRPLMSFGNALLSQDVPSVVYTLWPIEDEAAAAFAVEFHRGIAAGASRAEAVRAAQRSLLQVHPDRPHLWGAFAIAGAHVPLTE